MRVGHAELRFSADKAAYYNSVNFRIKYLKIGRGCSIISL